jgi:hypothetical protein
MNRTLLSLFALAAGALLIPDVADAQHGRFGGGGGPRMSVGGGPRMGGGSIGRPRMSVGGGPRMGGQRLWIAPPDGLSGPRIRTGGDFGGRAIAPRPGGVPGRMAGIAPEAGGFRRMAINNPRGRFDTRFDNRFGNRGDWRYGVRPRGSWDGRYPYYRGRYPSYGRYYRRYPYYGGYYRRYPYYGWGWGLATGALIGAAATYPYYDYPYYDYQTPVASAGGYCVTPVRTCALISPAPIGTGCSCSIRGGRARGTVQ